MEKEWYLFRCYTSANVKWMHLSVFLGQRNDEDNLEEVKSFFRLKRSEELKSGHIKEILFPRLKLNRNFTNIGLR